MSLIIQGAILSDGRYITQENLIELGRVITGLKGGYNFQILYLSNNNKQVKEGKVDEHIFCINFVGNSKTQWVTLLDQFQFTPSTQ